MGDAGGDGWKNRLIYGDNLHAMAAGRAIFEKPWRHQVDQRRIELANLYSPYWQPRLVDNQKRNEGRTAAFAQGVVQ